MRNILILGAGKSSIVLIDYLVQYAGAEDWHITVADITVDGALQKTKGREHTTALGFDLNNVEERRKLIAASDIVISMLPAALHLTVANDCLGLKKNLVTPSYISEAMKAIGKEVADNGLIFMNEMGLDPGIDHMSAMQILDDLRSKGALITGFKSHCGGLVAPDNDDNPWHYKFTWNPRNVVLAGQGEGGIHFLLNGNQIDLKYEDLFASAANLSIEGYGIFETYPNRDSLRYIDDYGLAGIGTMYRGTLRVSPYCKGWNCLVKLGLTRELEIPLASLAKTDDEIVNALGISRDSVEYALLKWLNLPERLQSIKQSLIVPSKFLQTVLEEKWLMKPGDKDMVVMIHEIDYTEALGEKRRIQSSLVCLGKDEEHTAMAATVGLPVAIVTKLILNGQVNHKGVLMPKYADIYNPILAELKQYGIIFNEQNLTQTLM